MTMAVRSKQFKDFVAISLCAAFDGPMGGNPIIVARMTQDDLAPSLMDNPFGGPWTRGHVLGWVMNMALEDRPVIVGIDAPLGLPFVDDRAYFTGHQESPENLPALWDLVMRRCIEDSSLLAHRIIDESMFGAYFATADAVGGRFHPNYRVCEAAMAKEIQPPSLLDLREGSARTLAGLSAMRMARLLKLMCGRTLAIWPTDRPKPGQPTLVEYFPPTFWRTAAVTTQEAGTLEALNRALRSFRVGQIAASPDMPETSRYCDTILAAAGLKVFFPQTEAWMPRKMNDAVARHEGWPFGQF